MLLAFLGLTFTAFAAQQTPPQEQAPGAQAQAVNPSEDKLESVAKAYVKVQAVEHEYEPKIQAAQKPEQAQQLQDEARQKMVKAVSDTGGVTVDEYAQIMQAAQKDGQLRSRLIQHIQKQPAN
jgi:hypothetical protein